MKEVQLIIATTCKDLFNIDIDVELTRPHEQFGDYATNIALHIALELEKSPREVAEAIAAHIHHNLIAGVSVAGPGFINIRLSDEALWTMVSTEVAPIFKDQTWVVEYSCPNAFKELHTGHLYNTVAGDVLARLVERAGATVHRTSFGGDVGLHVGKCMWGILRQLGGENPEKLQDVPESAFDRASWVSQCYVLGAQAYEEDDLAKQQIIEINQRIYKIHSETDQSTAFARIYFTCRQWSFDYFKAFYDLIQVPHMRYYPESETTERGMAAVQEQLANGHLEESDGAVVFRGDESKKLHTRVFITSKGLPTYETKDVGVILAEKEEYSFDHRLLLTGNDQAEYMKVVFAAMDTFYPGLASTMTHITNGTVRFGDGKKMSSRLGNVSRAVDVVEAVTEQVKSQFENQALSKDIALGAIKYEFMRHRIGGDITFDVEESVSIHGNSGPYLQYAHARACSILRKTHYSDENTQVYSLEPGERSLVSKLGQYKEIVTRATQEFMPHYICTYLYELAQAFNSFYEHNRVAGDPRERVRCHIVMLYANTLRHGLELLGIAAPERI